MPAEERANFKLSPGLGGMGFLHAVTLIWRLDIFLGFSTTIYQRIIKKVYDIEKGSEVIEALHQNPAVAVPIVLKRLKQKDEEWKRSQREWNKIWREIDLKNFSKALDHQAVNFKNTDRKSVVQKYLISEIEVLYHEQKEKRSQLANRYQFDFSFKNREMFTYVHQILLNFVETSAVISTSEEENIRALLADFVPKMFLIDPQQLDPAAPAENGEVQAKDSSAPMEIDPPVVAEVATSKDESAMDVDATEVTEKPLVKKRTSHTIYANNSLYTFFRLYQVWICFFLLLFLTTSFHAHHYFRCSIPALFEWKKSLTNWKEQNLAVKSKIILPWNWDLEKMLVRFCWSFLCSPSHPFHIPVAITMTEKDRFSELVKDICLFANNEVDASDFEDKTRELFWTSGYIIFTVDKLI